MEDMMKKNLMENLRAVRTFIRTVFNKLTGEKGEARQVRPHNNIPE